MLTTEVARQPMKPSGGTQKLIKYANVAEICANMHGVYVHAAGVLRQMSMRHLALARRAARYKMARSLLIAWLFENGVLSAGALIAHRYG